MEFAEGLLVAMVRIGIPILWLVLGEIVVERAGVLNIGLEGMLLVGAFGGFVGAMVWGTPWAGLLVGVLAATTLAAAFGAIVVRGGLDPIVTGIALNTFALGSTGVLHRAISAEGSVFVNTFSSWAIPVLANLPVLGPAFFAFNALGWAALVTVVVVTWFLGRTNAGLLTRATGEAPEVVWSAGSHPERIRFFALLWGGVCAGFAGVYLACGYSNTFVENMSAGRGFVALAIVVFARWRPWVGLSGALLFGLAMATQVRLQGKLVLGVEIPYQFFQMLPYALTLVVLATTARHGFAGPAALGKPFRRGS